MHSVLRTPSTEEKPDDDEKWVLVQPYFMTSEILSVYPSAPDIKNSSQSSSQDSSAVPSFTNCSLYTEAFDHTRSTSLPAEEHAIPKRQLLSHESMAPFFGFTKPPTPILSSSFQNTPESRSTNKTLDNSDARTQPEGLERQWQGDQTMDDTEGTAGRRVDLAGCLKDSKEVEEGSRWLWIKRTQNVVTRGGGLLLELGEGLVTGIWHFDHDIDL